MEGRPESIRSDAPRDSYRTGRTDATIRHDGWLVIVCGVSAARGHVAAEPWQPIPHLPTHRPWRDTTTRSQSHPVRPNRASIRAPWQPDRKLSKKDDPTMTKPNSAFGQPIGTGRDGSSALPMLARCCRPGIVRRPAIAWAWYQLWGGRAGPWRNIIRKTARGGPIEVSEVANSVCNPSAPQRRGPQRGEISAAGTSIRASSSVLSEIVSGTSET